MSHNDMAEISSFASNVQKNLKIQQCAYKYGKKFLKSFENQPSTCIVYQIEEYH